MGELAPSLPQPLSPARFQHSRHITTCKLSCVESIGANGRSISGGPHKKPIRVHIVLCNSLERTLSAGTVRRKDYLVAISVVPWSFICIYLRPIYKGKTLDILYGDINRNVVYAAIPSILIRISGPRMFFPKRQCNIWVRSGGERKRERKCWIGRPQCKCQKFHSRSISRRARERGWAGVISI